jgi:uncharacterized protein YdaU (DUF1376 family)
LNFYKHHLGDYDGATAHLSWDEDMAYTRLLRAYYRREKPIGEGEAYRLCRASSRAQRTAVDSVLSEFFTKAEDGWHNKRADEEVTAYQSQADTNRRIAQGRSRQRTVNESSNEPSTNRPPAYTDTGTPNQEPLTRERSKEAAAPPADPLWGEGLQVLTAANVPIESARTFVGKCLKDWTADIVLDALRESRGTADPKAYALRLLQAKQRKPGRGADPTRGAV